MKLRHQKANGQYIEPSDNDILQAYLLKHSYNRAEARRIKRQLRKLAYF